MIIPAQVPNAGMPVGDPLAQRLEQVEDAGQLGHRGGLPAREDEAVDRRRAPPGRRTGRAATPSGLEGAQVLADVALQGEDANA